jgi:D-threo-aldose 1-dehydrogenase
MNQTPMLTRFAREGDFDVLLVANRYTLLDQGALTELFPTCEARGIAVVLGGVFNSGILANPRPGSRFGYLPAGARPLAQAMEMRAICERHGVPLQAAAIQFSLAHPVVTAMLAGVRSAAQLDDYPGLMRRTIPSALWAELKAEALLPEDAITPDSVAPTVASPAPTTEDPS